MRHTSKALALALMSTLPLSLAAQNPIISSQFSADPTARVFEGRLYVYPSHDIPPVNAPQQRPDWFCMADYHCYSSSNLTDWTDHGVILDQHDVPWGNKEAYSMWAPDCVQGKDGRYYFYFPDAPAEGRGFTVGVAVADHPYGPFKALDTNIKGIMGIDPSVLLASNGKNYIFWGGGGLRVAELKDNLVELTDETFDNATTTPQGFKMIGTSIDGLPEGFKEGPFAFERNGKYYLTYPWVRGKVGELDPYGNVIENATECLAYAMADDPMGPYEYKGIIMKESPTHCWTNHHSLVEFEGQWYLFYHHNDYSPRFDKNRSVCADSLNFNPDGTIQEVIPTRRGIGVTDARTMVQIDRGDLRNGATIVYNDTVHPFDGWKVILPQGASVAYYSAKVPEGNYKTWVNTPGWFGRSSVKEITETTLKLTVQPQANGLSTLILSNEGKMPVEVDWISLNDRKPLTPATRGGIETGVYRNIFKEAGYTDAEIDAKLQEAFDAVFTGKNKCYFEVGSDMAYISDIKNHDVRTEGMSYGMMIAVQFGRKDIFDRLWRWSQKYMQHEDGPWKGYFRWSCKTDGTPNAEGPASDGELYYITSLIFASNLWGNNTGIDYLKEAQYLLDVIQPREAEEEIRFGRDGKPLDEPIKIKQTRALMDPKSQLISFVPGMPFTDPSYHLPAFYEVWARYAYDGRASYWRECARLSREYLHKTMHPFTGLNPDTNNFDGTLLENRWGFAPAFRYDSWRVPMNIALDYSWACVDRTWQQNYGEKIQNFFYSQGVETFLDQYNVDGTRPEHILRAGDYPEALRHSIGLAGTVAAVSLTCRHPKAYEFIDHFFNMKHVAEPDGYFDEYYDALIRLFAMMHLSGRYRVIEREMQYADYFQPVSANAEAATPDQDGFIRRWRILDPINKPNQSNTVFTDSYLREAFAADYTQEKKGLEWHNVDAQLWHVKLFRFASCRNKQVYGVIFEGETEIWCDEEMTNVRLAAGSNGASMWYLNGEEALLLSGDRRMVQDDGVSRLLTLKKGRNTLRFQVINGPGMSDACARFLDADGKPVTNLQVNIPTTGKKKKK